MTSFFLQITGTTIALGPPGGWEWIIILVIVLLLFGRRLPGVARSLGQGISSFKKGLNEPVDQDGKTDDDTSGSADKDTAKDESKSESA